MTVRTATDLLNRKSCIKLSTMMPPPPPSSIPQRPDTFFSFAPHSVNMRHSLLFSVQGLREREKNPSRKLPAPAKKNFPWKRQKKKLSGRPSPTCCNPRSLAERDGCVGWQISSEEKIKDEKWSKSFYLLCVNFTDIRLTPRMEPTPGCGRGHSNSALQSHRPPSPVGKARGKVFLTSQGLAADAAATRLIAFAERSVRKKKTITESSNNDVICAASCWEMFNRWSLAPL